MFSSEQPNLPLHSSEYQVKNIRIVKLLWSTLNSLIITIKMVGTKSRSTYKRKRTTFTGTQRQKIQRLDGGINRPTVVEVEDETPEPASI